MGHDWERGKARIPNRVKVWVWFDRSSAVFLQDIFTITMLINIYGGKPESENSGYLKTDFIKNTSFPLQHVPSSQGTHNFFVYSEP